MIEIVNGSLEEQIIKILQKIYPITIADLEKKLHLSTNTIVRVLQKLQSRGIVQLEPLGDTTFIRLLRKDFRFIGKKRQKKFIKHYTGEKIPEPGKYDGDMYS
ncbi:MAG: HTH domain-containing protein [Thermoplasmatota archaeon]